MTAFKFNIQIEEIINVIKNFVKLITVIALKYEFLSKLVFMVC